MDYFAFHQANKQIIRTVAMYAGLPKNKYSTETFSLYGNCGSAAVTVDVCRQLSEKPAKHVCMATFGVGLSWGLLSCGYGGCVCGAHLYLSDT